MPELRRLLVGDNPDAWIEAGFSVTNNETSIGGISLRFVEPEHPAASGAGGISGGIVGWELTDIGTDSEPDAAEHSIDGIFTAKTDGPPAEPISHANGVSHLDHVVVMTPDIERTTTALRSSGLSAKRTREVPGTDPVKLQVFFWAGETILEVVGPAVATGTGPASIWGLAVTTNDMDQAVAAVGPNISTPKPAVQPGRQIATINTRGLGMKTALALMTPHVPTDSPSDRH